MVPFPTLDTRRDELELDIDRLERKYIYMQQELEGIKNKYYKKFNDLNAVINFPDEYIQKQEQRLLHDIRIGRVEVVKAGTNDRVNITRFAM